MSELASRGEADRFVARPFCAAFDLPAQATAFTLVPKRAYTSFSQRAVVSVRL